MPNETKQPFTDPTQRSTDDRKLVAKVLGTKEAAEMAELVGGQVEPADQQQGVGELRLAESEQDAATRVEQEVTPDQRRRQYYEWADELGRNKSWVDEIFTFESDGRVKVKGDLGLGNTGIEKLPPGLYKVGGTLYLHDNQITKIVDFPDLVNKLYITDNQITKIENVPDSVTFLHLDGNQITKIENIPDSVKSLSVSDNQITTIENIPDSVTRLYIDGNQINKIENISGSVAILVLDYNPIESLDSLVGKKLRYLSIKGIKAVTIPERMEVDRIVLAPSQTELIADCKAKGYNITIE